MHRNLTEMKNAIWIVLLFCGQILIAQNILLNKVEKTHNNADKMLYKIDPEAAAAEYLGQIEVQGFSDNDVEVFGKIYAKAKQIGANAFAVKPFESVEGGAQPFDPAHYRLSLFYLPFADFPAENNAVYLIASPHNRQSVAFNKETIVFEPRTFIRRELLPGAVYTVSTKKFLGSSIRLSAQENQPVQYFQFSAFSVNSNPYGTAGINLKSGDITRLEQSYAQFLTAIYRQLE